VNDGIDKILAWNSKKKDNVVLKLVYRLCGLQLIWSSRVLLVHFEQKLNMKGDYLFQIYLTLILNGQTRAQHLLPVFDCLEMQEHVRDTHIVTRIQGNVQLLNN